MDFNDATTETNELINKTLEIALITILLELEGSSTLQQPQMRFSNPYQGQQYVEELLDSNHPDRVHAVLRMSKETFYSLRD